MRLVIAIGLSLAATGVPLSAQMHNNTEKQMTCGDGSNGDRARHCEIREQTLPSVGRFAVEGHNGGITVKGWLNGEVLIRAKVESHAETQVAADVIASRVLVDSGGGQVHATGPEDLDHNSSWSVSYEIFVPQSGDLTVKTHNGGVNISDLRGQIRFEAHNGGVHLNRVAGDVGGETHNGGIQIELMGSSWDGRQLQVSTYNGGVTVSMPAGYSAHLQAETENGRIQSDFPFTVSGELKPRGLETNIGAGGSLIHVTTHNGGVSLKRAG